MSWPRAQAVAILGTQTTDNNHLVRPLPQPSLSHVPFGSLGDTQTIAISSVQNDKPAEGTAPPPGTTPAPVPGLTCKIHMSRYPKPGTRAAELNGKKSHDLKVGLVIEALGGTVTLGPFFGTLNFGDNKRVLLVDFNTGPGGLLNGKITVTLQELTSNKYEVDASFNGRLSGATSANQKVAAQFRDN